MEYNGIRELLEELHFQLGGLFEHGLSGGARLSQPLRELAHRLEEAGMDYGARLAAELAGELEQSRLDAGWEAGRASEVFSNLWRYYSLCGRRLEYLEAQAQLAAEVT